MYSTRFAVPVALSAALCCMSGCTTDYRKDDGMFGGYEKITLAPGPADQGARDADGRVPAERMGFTLTEPRTIAGEQLRNHALVTGLRVRDREVLPLIFRQVVAWRSDFAFALRQEEGATFLRYDLDTGVAEPTPYTRVDGGRMHGGRYDVGYGWFPVYPAPLYNTSTVHFLGADGRSVGAIEQVFNVMHLGAGGHLVVHTELMPNTSIRKHWRIYDDRAQPLSPRLALENVLEWRRSYNGTPFFSIRCDPRRNDLSWPLRPDGTILPMPPGLLGVRGLGTTDWIAWAAVWATPEGERIAVINDPYDLDALVASRPRAQFDGIEVTSRVEGQQLNYTLCAIVSMPGATGWRVFDLPAWKETSERIFPTLAAAKEAVKAGSDAAYAQNQAAARAQRQEYLASIEAARRRNSEIESAARQAQFDRELRERQQAAASAASGASAADAVYWKNQFQYLTGQKW